MFIKHKKLYIVIIIICMILFFVFQKKTHTKKKPVYLIYEKLIKNINIKNEKNTNLITSFIIKNHNIYGTLTSLKLSKKYISINDFHHAKNILMISSKYTQDQILNNLIKLRIAKIQIEQQKIKNALNTINEINKKNWINITDIIRGDLIIFKKNKKMAILAWKHSLQYIKSLKIKKIIMTKINQEKNFFKILSN